MDLSELERLEAPAKLLKLSEAIRIGASMREQCKGQFFKEGKSCALGAALDAIGMKAFAEAYHSKHGGIWPWDKVETSFGEGIHSKLTTEIAKRNDHGESRESIADWLEAQGL